MMHNFDDHRLRTNGDRRFIETSATTDYVHTEIAALSTGDHIGLPRVLIHIAPHFQ